MLWADDNVSLRCPDQPLNLPLYSRAVRAEISRSINRDDFKVLSIKVKFIPAELDSGVRQTTRSTILDGLTITANTGLIYSAAGTLSFGTAITCHYTYIMRISVVALDSATFVRFNQTTESEVTISTNGELTGFGPGFK